MKMMVLFIMIVLCTACAVSDVLTFEISGSVSQINTNGTGVIPDISVGQSFTGWFSYDNSVEGGNYASGRYFYNQTTSAQFKVGEIQISHIDQQVGIFLDNDVYSIVDERYKDRLHYGFDTFISEFGPDKIDCSLYFLDNTSSSFDSFELPVSFDISAFDTVEFKITRKSQLFIVDGQIDEIALIPEPATLAMLALGGLLVRKRRVV